MRDLSLHLMDIIQNSIVAEATEIKISYQISSADHHLLISIEDNGKGMTPHQVEKVVHPFYTTRTTRDIGLGIPLYKMSAEATGGTLSILSELSVGTTLTVDFYTDHIDMLPEGDTASTILLLVTGNPSIQFYFSYDKDESIFVLDTKQLNDILDGVPLSDPSLLPWLKGFLKEGLGELK